MARRATRPAGGDRSARWRPFVDPAPVWLNAACKPAGLPASSMESTFLVDQAIESPRPPQGPQSLRAVRVGRRLPRAPFPVQVPRRVGRPLPPRPVPRPAVSDADRLDQPKVFAALTPDEVRGDRRGILLVALVPRPPGRPGPRRPQGRLGTGRRHDRGLPRRQRLHARPARADREALLLRARRPRPPDPPLARPPPRPTAGSTGLVELVDLLPTLLDLAGQPAPPDLPGPEL